MALAGSCEGKRGCSNSLGAVLGTTLSLACLLRLLGAGDKVAGDEVECPFNGHTTLVAMLRASTILCAAVITLGILSSGCVVDWLGGASSRKPDELNVGLSEEAKALIRRAFAGLDRDRLADHHVHLLGLGSGNTGNWINPKNRSWLSPFERVRFSVYLDAGGVEDVDQADAQYVGRLVRLIRALPVPSRHYLLAFDKHYRPDGSIDEEKTEFFVPNDYVFAVAQRHPELLVPVMSVHPYRSDALDALERWADRGGRLIKWLPNAMGIDPASHALDGYYDKVRELGLVILAHTGEEQAVEAEEDQRLGNPLRFRRALDRGVHVIMAHAASLGENEDLDHPTRPRVSSFSLFLRLMDEQRYEGLLLGEISATTQFNRVGEALSTLLRRQDLHSRLLNGSDYPLPAVNVLIHTGSLADAGYITDDEARMLSEIYDYNPLLFDFVLKRSLRAPGTDIGFAQEVFYDKLGITSIWERWLETAAGSMP